MAKDYIEKDQVHDILAGQFCACSDEVEETINAIWAEVRALPAANVRENVKGVWRQTGGKYSRNKTIDRRNLTCSICGNFLYMEGVNAGRGDANFCPNCGAEMTGEVGVL